MKSKVLFGLSIISSMLIILLQFFTWSIIEITAIFYVPFIWLFVFIFFLFVTIAAVISLFKHKIWMPLIIQSATIGILFFFPFTQAILMTDFKVNKQDREKVASMVDNKTLTPNIPDNPGLIKLPKEFEHLSQGGGEIIVKNDTLLFFTFRGLLDNFSGLVYSPDGQASVQENFCEDSVEIEQLDEGWYSVVSN
jgi:hypothetical protein